MICTFILVLEALGLQPGVCPMLQEEGMCLSGNGFRNTLALQPGLLELTDI
jgi:hypothetical protein